CCDDRGHDISSLSSTLAVVPPFFFHVPAAHPALPSFPTRRSSDLADHRRRHHDDLAQIGGVGKDLLIAGQIGGEDDQSVRLSGRSEEHTSELQSRSDLVCRLLLEKKKHSNNSSHSLVVLTITMTPP